MTDSTSIVQLEKSVVF